MLNFLDTPKETKFENNSSNKKKAILMFFVEFYFVLYQMRRWLLDFPLITTKEENFFHNSWAKKFYI